MLAYSTTTGQTAIDNRPAAVKAAEVQHLFEDYCFICHRSTDHFGEHDDVEGVVYESWEEVSEDGATVWHFGHVKFPRP